MPEEYYSARVANELIVLRKKNGLSQRRVALLLGHQHTTMLSKYENSHLLPPLATALRLEIIYRTRLSAMFPRLYKALEAKVEMERKRIGRPIQGTLF